MENTTNQVFPIMPDSLLESWKDKVQLHQTREGWMRAIRLSASTSWITSGEQVDILVNDIFEQLRWTCGE